MSPETLAMLRAYNKLVEPKYDLLRDAYQNHTDKMEEKASVPTVSFKDKKLKSVKENSTTLLAFFINGEYVRLGGTKYDIQLTCDSKSVTFSTTSWSEMEEGFTIKTKITTKDPEVINIAFKFDGKESNSLNLVVAATQVEKPEKCICKKTTWSANDLKYIITQLRKKDNVFLQAQYEKGGKFDGNPIYVDKSGKLYHNLNQTDSKKLNLDKYEISTSFYDRADDIDGKPLKDRIFFYDSDAEDDSVNYNLNSEYANYETFAKYLSLTFENYSIKDCIQKIHFLAQIYVETNRFRTTYEDDPKNIYSGGKFYRGRGMKQITHDYNYLRYYDERKGKGKNLYSKYYDNRKSNFDPKKGPVFVESVIDFKNRTENKFITDDEMKEFNEFVPLLSTSIYWACDSAGWYWNKEKLNNFANDDENAIIVVSAKINKPSASNNSSGKGINDLKERKAYFESLKQILDYENCK